MPAFFEAKPQELAELLRSAGFEPSFKTRFNVNRPFLRFYGIKMNTIRIKYENPMKKRLHAGAGAQKTAPPYRHLDILFAESVF